MHFQLAGLCFTDSAGIAFHHDRGLVVLSYLVAACGSYTALETIERWRSAPAGRAIGWHLASAAVLGGTIWSMHFIAMLALRIEVPVTYAPEPTVLSLAIATSGVGLGLQIVHTRLSWLRIAAAGTVVGLAVGTMHYVGMAAVEFPGGLAYTAGFWSLSLVVAIAAATIAFWLSLTVQRKIHRAAAALVMGAAICGMHYTGMASAVFQFDSLAAVTAPGVDSALLAAMVASISLLLILYALAFVASDRRLVEAEARESDVLRRANAELERRREQFDAAISNMSQGLTFFDGDQKLVVCNQRFGEIYNLPPELMRPGTPLIDILNYRIANGSFPNMTAAAFLARRDTAGRAGKAYVTVKELRDGRSISMHYQPLPNGGWVTTYEDITERRRTEANMVFMARHDLLTKLPNRTLFHERLEQEIGLTARGDGCAVLCLDLDHFKLINETLGHETGDALLQAAAERLQFCVREVDTVARLGGDEFAIIQQAVKQPDDVGTLANRIISAFHKPFDLNGHQVVIGVSVGAAIAPGDGATFNKLVNSADIALRLAKSEGRGVVRFFEPEMDARLEKRRLLELDLRGALVRNEFEVHYQPLIALSSDRVVEFEALVRWRHPARGLVSPVDFIPLSEETGMIVSIGEWILRTACREAQNWPDEIRIAVNLSPVQFRQVGLVHMVENALSDSGLLPDRLELEITESCLLQESDATLSTLHNLRALGVSIALDDFGTGYSSLSYLHRFPFDKIKIDQSFVRDMPDNKDSMSIVRAICGLGHSLNLKTTAEGVETQRQLDILRDEGCTQVQGYLISRPQPAHEIPGLIDRIQAEAEGGQARRRLVNPEVCPASL